MSSKPRWRILSPAPYPAVLELARAQVRVRRLLVGQARNAETIAVYRDELPLAVVYLGPHGWRRTEMALSIAPAAAQHMRFLVRLAQMTLVGLADTRLIVASVNPANRAGQRMAVLVGFRPARTGNARWVFRNGRSVHGKEPAGSAEGRRGFAPAAAGRQ